MRLFGLNLRSLVLVVVIGVCVGVFTGAVENRPNEYSIMQEKYYGYPLIWRVIQITAYSEYYLFESLLIDCMFWFVIVLAVVLLLAKLAKV